MQRDNIELYFSLEILHKLREFLISFKENGFQMSEITAKELAKELEMSDAEMGFPPVVSLRRKRVKKNSFHMNLKINQYKILEKNTE